MFWVVHPSILRNIDIVGETFGHVYLAVRRYPDTSSIKAGEVQILENQGANQLYFRIDSLVKHSVRLVFVNTIFTAPVFDCERLIGHIPYQRVNSYIEPLKEHLE